MRFRRLCSPICPLCLCCLDTSARIACAASLLLERRHILLQHGGFVATDQYPCQHYYCRLIYIVDTPAAHENFRMFIAELSRLKYVYTNVAHGRGNLRHETFSFPPRVYISPLSEGNSGYRARGSIHTIMYLV